MSSDNSMGRNKLLTWAQRVSPQILIIRVMSFEEDEGLSNQDQQYPHTALILNSDTSRSFDNPKAGRIAVKVINHLGDEVMKVFRVL